MKPAIVLDANILIADPFFQSATGNLLLEFAQSGLVDVFVPEVAIQEAIHHLKKQYDALEQEALQRLDQLGRLNKDYPRVKSPDRDAFHTYVGEFYRRHENIKILDPDIADFKQVLAKAVVKKAPFFEDKRSEFKDAVIWEGVVRLAGMESFSEVYIVTGNYRDFWNQQRDALHPVLEEEVNKKVSARSSVLDFIERHTTLKQKKSSREFQEWFSTQRTALPDLEEAITRYGWNQMASKISEQLSGVAAKTVFPDDELGYIVPRFDRESFELKGIRQVTFYSDFAVIETDGKLSFAGDVYLADRAARKFTMQYSSLLKCTVRTKFSYNREGLFRPLEVLVSGVDGDDLDFANLAPPYEVK
jgi:predicted nucleic acid-binding protein